MIDHTRCFLSFLFFFFFNDTATTEIYTLSLHDALPIYFELAREKAPTPLYFPGKVLADAASNRLFIDRKSTRLNSSHANISYAVFCLKKKNNTSHRIVYCLHTMMV